MNKIKLRSYLTLLLLIPLYLLAWFMQDKFLLKGDVSWQLHLAKILLSGGNYVKDFFEINPPLSIYLYIPAIYLQKMFSFSNIIALRTYIFIFATLSLLLCYFLLNNISENKDKRIQMTMIIALFFTYLILPFAEFGQRECLSLYLTMPYFLLVSLRLNDKKINHLPALSIGVLAGLGFAIKPFFIFAFCLVEFYCLLGQKSLKESLFSWIRTETLSIFLVFILYLIFIYFFHPDYLKIVIPIASHFYYQSFSVPLKYVIANALILYILLAPCLYPIFSMNKAYNKVAMVLLMAMMGFFIAYLIQQLPWYYHLFPALALTIIIYMLSFSILLTTYSFNKSEFIVALLLIFIAFSYPYHFLKTYYAKSVRIKLNLQPLIDELQANKQNQYVYFLSSSAAYMVSVFEHANALHASRLQFLAWMQRYHYPERFMDPNQLKKNEQFFVNMLVEDLKKNRPALIYVDRLEFIAYDETQTNLDYIQLLSRYPQFKEIWKNYHYWKTVEMPNMYKFDIYIT